MANVLLLFYVFYLFHLYFMFILCLIKHHMHRIYFVFYLFFCETLWSIIVVLKYFTNKAGIVWCPFYFVSVDRIGSAWWSCNSVML